MNTTKSDDALAAVVKEIADEQTELERLLPLDEPKFNRWPKKRKRLSADEQIAQLILKVKAEGE